jgi:hypothetical protein
LGEAGGLLLDACVPRMLKKELGTTHNTWTARERGWNGLADGLLLAAMEGQIDSLITVDKGLRWQQRLDGRTFAVVLLRAKSNTLRELVPLIPALLRVLDEVKPGEVREVGG